MIGFRAGFPDGPAAGLLRWFFSMKTGAKRVRTGILLLSWIFQASAGACSASGVAAVKVETLPSGIEVYADGLFRGNSPVSWRASEGRLSLEFHNGDGVVTEDAWVSATAGDTLILGPFFVKAEGALYDTVEATLFPEASDPFPYLFSGVEGELTSFDRVTHFGHGKLDLAMQLYYEKSYEQALAIWRQLLLELPSFADICIYRAGLCLCGLDEYDAAVIEFRRVTSLYAGSHTSGLCFYQLGRCFLALGEREKGIVYLSRFLKEEGRSGLPLVSHAETLINLFALESGSRPGEDFR